jgi:hypothetical protein
MAASSAVLDEFGDKPQLNIVQAYAFLLDAFRRYASYFFLLRNDLTLL